MNGIILFLAAGLGIQYGWQQRDDGAVEYIIQVDEAGLEALKDGLPLTSAIPPELSRIDRVRIQVGTGELPRSPIVESRPVSAVLMDAQTTNEVPRSEAQVGPRNIDLASFNTVPIESIPEIIDSVASRAVAEADTAPQLVQTYWSNKQNQWNTAPQTQSAPTNQPPPVIPVAPQQSTGGLQTVRNSTLSQNSGFPTMRTADANSLQNQTQLQTQPPIQNQTQQQTQPTQQPAPNTQTDPRTIGTYDPNRYPTQPNTTLDSRQGTITFGTQPNEYQQSLSEQNNSTRVNNLDGFLRSNQANDLEAVTPRWTLPPNPAYPAIPQAPNSAFTSQQNQQAVNGQNTGSPYQTPRPYPQPPLYPQPNPPLLANSPYASPNPYATSPYSVYNQLPYANRNPYADPYLRAKTDEESREEIAELRKEFKDVLAELSKRDEVVTTTPASRNESVGQELSSDTEKSASSSPNWTIAILTMLVSIGANFYLAWIALSFYHRYRSLAEDMRDMNRFESH